MKPQKLSLEAIKNAHAELTDIFERKNKDYGNSFEESLEKHGLIAAVVRMEDKMLRLTNLSKKESEQLVNNESLIDTLKDLSNYALMTAVWLEQTQLLKEVPFVKDNEDFDMTYFDGYGNKFKNIINDIIRFDPDLIITSSITFDNKIHPKYIMFDTINIEKINKWFKDYPNHKLYSLRHHYDLEIQGTGRILINLKKDEK